VHLPRRHDEVELADFEFKPVCVEASAGDTLALTNSGQAPHTYTVSDSDVNVNLDAGETGEAVLGDLAVGTYAVRCTYHPQMVARSRSSDPTVEHRPYRDDDLPELLASCAMRSPSTARLTTGP